MKKRLLAAVIGLMGLSLGMLEAKEEVHYNTKISADVQYSIIRGLEIHAGEEIRLNEKFGFARTYTNAGLSYKPVSWLKLGLDYYAIGVQKTDEIIDGLTGDTSYKDYTDWKHRVAFSVIGSYKYGGWHFSLRERIQGSYRMKDVNKYQSTRFLVASRTRAKVSYKFFNVPIEPYVAFELRAELNAPKWQLNEDFVPDTKGNATFLGYKDAYLDRYRTELGVDWQLRRNHFLNFAFTYDRTLNKEIDSNKEGTKLKTPIIESWENRLYFGIGYTFKF